MVGTSAVLQVFIFYKVFKKMNDQDFSNIEHVTSELDGQMFNSLANYVKSETVDEESLIASEHLHSEQKIQDLIIGSEGIKSEPSDQIFNHERERVNSEVNDQDFSRIEHVKSEVSDHDLIVSDHSNSELQSSNIQDFESQDGGQSFDSVVSEVCDQNCTGSEEEKCPIVELSGLVSACSKNEDKKETEMEQYGTTEQGTLLLECHDTHYNPFGDSKGTFPCFQHENVSSHPVDVEMHMASCHGEETVGVLVQQKSSYPLTRLKQSGEHDSHSGLVNNWVHDANHTPAKWIAGFSQTRKTKNSMKSSKRIKVKHMVSLLNPDTASYNEMKRKTEEKMEDVSKEQSSQGNEKEIICKPIAEHDATDILPNPRIGQSSFNSGLDSRVSQVKRNLSQHCKSHPGKDPHTLPISAPDEMGKGFASRSLLLNHNGHDPYKHDVCDGRDKEFRWTCNSAPLKPYKCKKCDEVFEKNSQLRSHKRIHTKDKPFTCDVCGKGFDCSGPFTYHKRTHTGEKPYKCDLCGKAFRGSGHLISHKRTHTGEKPYKCLVCGKGFGCSGYLNAHKKAHSSEKPYKCDVCGRGFGYRSHLTVHIRTHTSEKPYTCGVCGASFGKNSLLTYHRRTHTGEKPYKCDVCGKAFRGSGHLTSHKKTHTGEKPYKCDVCDKGFSCSGYLNAHKKTHSSEKPYKCDVCGRGFGYRSYLTVHTRTHTGEKPYTCGVCGASFGRSSLLTYHKRTHTGEKPYKCDVCDKGFSCSGYLNAHKKTHSSERPHKCDLCGRGFRFSRYLRVHKKTHTCEKTI